LITNYYFIKLCKLHKEQNNKNKIQIKKVLIYLFKKIVKNKMKKIRKN